MGGLKGRTLILTEGPMVDNVLAKSPVLYGVSPEKTVWIGKHHPEEQCETQYQCDSQDQKDECLHARRLGDHRWQKPNEC